jgi:endonuclease/exonuclease/phosphatase family metal-dependent hydrolase
MKDSYYKELECALDKFSKYHIKIVLGDFNAKASREDFSKLTIGNESLHKITSINDKSECRNYHFPHCNIYLNQTDHIFIHRIQRSSVHDVRSFGTVNCDDNHYLVVAKVR